MEESERGRKGIEICLKADLIRLSDRHYTVRSQTSKRQYDVAVVLGKWVCNCADHINRHVKCKHILAVEQRQKIREETIERNRINIFPIEGIKCEKCSRDNIIKYGIRHNKSGDVQRYFCKDCNIRFVPNLAFKKIHAPAEVITSVMSLYYGGMSYRTIQNYIIRNGVNVTYQTVYNWVVKYTKMINAYVSGYNPQVGDAWRADEVYVNVRGERKYLFSMMDAETRFWIDQEVLDTKDGADASNLFRKGMESIGTKPKVIITDGLPSYSVAYRKVFWTANREDRTIHISNIHLQKDRNNNQMERLNGEFRDREKPMRGVKKKDSIIFDGYQLYHNFLRPHMALGGRTPAEACGIEIHGTDKWLTLIQNACRDSVA